MQLSQSWCLSWQVYFEPFVLLKKKKSRVGIDEVRYVAINYLTTGQPFTMKHWMPTWDFIYLSVEVTSSVNFPSIPKLYFKLTSKILRSSIIPSETAKIYVVPINRLAHYSKLQTWSASRDKKKKKKSRSKTTDTARLLLISSTKTLKVIWKFISDLCYW